MSKAFPLLLVGSALVLAACASKKPPLPPAASQPPPAAPVQQPQTIPPSEPVGSSILPGSQAALVAAAGSDTVYFAFDSYALDSDAQSILSKQAQWFNQNPNVNGLVEGHTDERGTREYNLALGERRANASKNFLVTQGVTGSRIDTISYGKDRPAVEGSNEAAWAKNRRTVTNVVSGGR